MSTAAPPTDAVRYLGVWFSFTGPDGRPGRTVGRANAQSLERPRCAPFFGKLFLPAAFLRADVRSHRGHADPPPLVPDSKAASRCGRCWTGCAGSLSQWVHRTLGSTWVRSGERQRRRRRCTRNAPTAGLGVPGVTNILHRMYGHRRGWQGLTPTSQRSERRTCLAYRRRRTRPPLSPWRRPFRNSTHRR